MSNATKKVVLLLDKEFEDAEAIYPYYRLQEAGADVWIIGASKGETFTGKHGYPLRARTSIDHVKAAEVDAVVIPGGHAPDHIRRSLAALAFVKVIHDSGKPVAAICHAGSVLISAGIVEGRECTSFSSIKDDMENAGALWRDEAVVVDRNLITSRTPDDLPKFCAALITALGLGTKK